jgi:hypothetical protein
MSRPGDVELMRQARAVLLDALDALEQHRDALVLIGARAIYLHTDAAKVALPELTKDSDLAIDRRELADEPLLEQAMIDAGFAPGRDPGLWTGAFGVPIDLMMPEGMSDPGGRRGGRMPPHSSRAVRKATGLEAAIVDNAPITITALDVSDRRRITVNVAGPAARLVAKMHKLGDRAVRAPERMHDKDAHDVYRLLVAIDTQVLVDALRDLRRDDLAAAATEHGLQVLEQLFSPGASATGCAMAGRAEEGLGDPETVAASTALLASDVLEALR